jgi:hypothetical protein
MQQANYFVEMPVTDLVCHRAPATVSIVKYPGCAM